jgi:hypothetical protein
MASVSVTGLYSWNNLFSRCQALLDSLRTTRRSAGAFSFNEHGLTPRTGLLGFAGLLFITNTKEKTHKQRLVVFVGRQRG